MRFYSNGHCEFEVRSFTRSRDNSGYLKNFGQSLDTPFKGDDFGTNRKRVYDFLLVRNSNLGPILHRFRDIAGFLRSRVTPPIFNLNFGGVPVAPDRPCWGQPWSRGLKLFGREIIFEVIPTYVITIPERHTQTDRQTDMIAISRFALKCIAR